MKLNKISQVGIIVGLALMASSWIRYYIIIPDLDKALAYVAIGFLIAAVSYLYDRIRRTEGTLFTVEEWIQDNIKENNNDN